MTVKATTMSAALSLFLFSVTFVSVKAQDSIFSIHGSGTSNPSKCFWRIMDKLQFQTQVPTRLTYRAIGSSSGMEEFKNPSYVVDFASGDLPLTREVYDDMTSSQGAEVIQLPVVLGAVSFFHNVPNTPNLNLTACMIARIYKGEITEWDDPEILAENPTLVLPAGGLAVKAKHRTDGSSSTSVVTGYLATACPSAWPAEDQGTTIEWKGGSEGCQGSSAMTTCIQDTDGTIGYQASGHGHDALLQEPVMKNQFGTRLTSEEAYLLGGVEGAANAASLADSPADFFPVSQFINEPGEYIWPMVLMTYIYVRKDLTYIESPTEQALLKAFLKSLYKDEYITQCEEDYEFTRVAGPALELAMEGIDSLILSADAPEFVFETSIEAITGAGKYVVSTKRNSIADVERGLLVSELGVLEEEVRLLREALDRSALEQDATNFKITNLEAAVAGSGSSGWNFILSASAVSAITIFVF